MGQQEKNYEENKKIGKNKPKVSHTRLDLTFFLCIYLLHQQSPYHAMYKFARGQDLLTNPPSPPILGSNDKHYARPPVSEQKNYRTVQILPTFLRLSDIHGWALPKMGERLQIRVVRILKKKANGTNQDCFSDWFFFGI